ncbi:MAG: DUF924 domain-containing protein [Polyangiaceae bacterium]|nr:DUF924 domain-containing protein [Polyangiaceae bacterium]
MGNTPEKDILDFWFGALDSQGRASSETRSRWFKKDPAFDAQVKDHFSAVHNLLSERGRPSWTRTPTGLCAAIIVLDQFSRNIFRGSKEAFANDERALELSFEMISMNWCTQLSNEGEAFCYLPLMHSERLEVQERCVELFELRAKEQLATEHRVFENYAKYARSHHEIIVRYGRFPHRNKALGRVNTPEEVALLESDPSGF